MIRKTAVLSIAMLFVAGSAFASPDKKPVVKKAKTVEVTVCPIAGDSSKGSAITEKVDNYNVHFCCPSCKPAFDKLSKKDKLSKIQAALKGGGAKKAEKVEAKLTAINVCPITGEKVEGDGGGSLVVGKYEVHFCCAGCKPAFEKMSQSEKEAKIQEILKKS